MFCRWKKVLYMMRLVACVSFHHFSLGKPLGTLEGRVKCQITSKKCLAFFDAHSQLPPFLPTSFPKKFYAFPLLKRKDCSTLTSRWEVMRLRR